MQVSMQMQILIRGHAHKPYLSHSASNQLIMEFQEIQSIQMDSQEDLCPQQDFPYLRLISHQIQGFFRKTIVFRINYYTQHKTFSFQRQQSDIEWLHEQLFYSLPQVALPPLYCKNVLMNISSDTNQKKQGYQIFLNACLSNKVISQTSLFISFISQGKFQIGKESDERRQLNFLSLPQLLKKFKETIFAESIKDQLLNKQFQKAKQQKQELEVKLSKFSRFLGSIQKLKLDLSDTFLDDHSKQIIKRYSYRADNVYPLQFELQTLLKESLSNLEYLLTLCLNFSKIQDQLEELNARSIKSSSPVLTTRIQKREKLLSKQSRQSFISQFRQNWTKAFELGQQRVQTVIEKFRSKWNKKSHS